MMVENLKPLLIRGNFDDKQLLFNVAVKQAKAVFHTNGRIIVKDYKLFEPYGWIVLVARPQVVEDMPLVDWGGDKKMR